MSNIIESLNLSAFVILKVSGKKTCWNWHKRDQIDTWVSFKVTTFMTTFEYLVAYVYIVPLIVHRNVYKVITIREWSWSTFNFPWPSSVQS